MNDRRPLEFFSPAALPLSALTASVPQYAATASIGSPASTVTGNGVGSCGEIQYRLINRLYHG